MRLFVHGLVVFLVLLGSSLIFEVNAQTKGFIFETGSSVLDPDQNGYVSDSTSGFSNDGFDVDEFEITMFPMIILGGGEVSGDIGSGPNCGFTDLAPDSNGATVYTTLDDSDNLVFRFRVADFKPNAKGYTILIDADNAFGSYDANATSINPGFEIALFLRTNNDVSVADIDGVDNCGAIDTVFALSSHHQKSIAGQESCGDADYFYDFYVPFSVLASAFGITTSTPLRMIPVTSTSNSCALEGNASDVGGVDDDAYGGCLTCIYEDMINGQVATPLDSLCPTCSGFPPARTTCPTINAAYSGDTSITGTSVINAQVFIEIHYTDGAAVEYDTVTADGAGNWSLNALDSLLDQNDSITATALAPGMSMSLTNCVYRWIAYASNCTPEIIDTSLTINTKGLCGALGSAFPGAEIRVYLNGTLQTPNAGSIYSSGTVTVQADSAWIWKCNGSAGCTSGGPCLSNGSYAVTQQLPGECESNPIFICLGLASSASTPAITTTTLSIGSTSVAGTSDSSATIYVYQNGGIIGTTTANASGMWTFGGLSLTLCDSIQVRATTTGTCASALSSAIYVTDVSATPSLVCGMKAGDTFVNGIGTGNALDTVFIYHVDVSATLTYVDTVYLTAYKNFQGYISNTMEAGDSIYARISGAGCYSSGSVSDTCVVQDTASAPTLDCSLNYGEGDTAISGTHASVGAAIVIYIDGDSIGSAIVDGSNNWSAIVSVSALYAGGSLYATAFVPGNAESDSSNICLVSCALPATNLNLTFNDSNVCQQVEQGEFTLESSEAGIIYEPYDTDLDVVIGSSVLGTGNDILMRTNLLVNDPTNVSVLAFKLVGITCEAVLQDTLTFVVDPSPDTTLSVMPADTSICVGQSINLRVLSSELGVKYQLYDSLSASLVGSAIPGTGGTIQLPTGNVDSAMTFGIIATDTTGVSQCADDLTGVSHVDVVGPDLFVSVTGTAAMVCPLDAVTIDVQTENNAAFSYQVYRHSDTTVVGAAFTGDGTVFNRSSLLNALEEDFYVVVSFLGCTATLNDSVHVDMNQTPQAVNDTVDSIIHGQTFVFDVIANDSDPEGDTLTVSIVTQPNNGSAAVTNDSVQLIPSSTYLGVDSLEYSACDACGNCDTVKVFLTLINRAPIASNDALTVAEDDPQGYVDVVANDVDPDGDALLVSIIQGAAFGSEWVVGDSVGYTPNANFFGNDTVVYSVCDQLSPALCDTDTVFITVTPVNDAPVAINDTVTVNEDDVDAALIVLLNDSDLENDGLTVTILISSSNGSDTVSFGDSILYSPNLNYNGPDSIQYMVCDDGSPSACDTAMVYITVTPVNDAPVAVVDFFTVSEDTTNAVVDVQFNDSDVEGNILTTSVINGPWHGSFSILNTDSISYSPDLDYFGNDTLVYSVCDGGSLCDTDTVFITVSPVNDAPVATNDLLTIDEDALNASIVVLSNDSDVENDGLTVTIITAPVNGTAFVSVGDSLDYTPNANYFGSDSIQYLVCDDGTPSECDTAMVYITIDPVNDAPLAVVDFFTVTEDTTNAVVDVQFNDSDVEASILTTSVISGPWHGSFSILNTDSISYSPDLDYFGSDTLVYSVCDVGSLCDTDTVFITVTPVNDAPMAVNDTVSVVEESIGNIFVVQSNDYDIEGDSLTTSILTLPSNGTASLSGTDISYSPDSNYYGFDSVLYEICDNGTPSLCNAAYVYITVTSINDAPVAATDYASVLEDTPGDTLDVLSNDTDPELDSLYSNIITQPTSGGTATVLNGDSIIYIPPSNFNGADTLIYSVCDDGFPNLCDTDTVFINVIPVNDAPVAAVDSITVSEDTSGVVIAPLLNDADVEGDSLHIGYLFSTQTLGTATFLNLDSLEISYDAPADFFGIDSIGYSVCEVLGAQACDSSYIYITITSVNDAPVALSDVVEFYVDTVNAVIDVQANDTDLEENLLTTSIISGPTSGGTVTVLNGDSLSYTPPASFLGADTILYSICDDGVPSLCDTDTVFINIVLTPNNPPTAQADIGIGADSTFIYTAVLLNDSDSDADGLLVEVVLPPSNGVAAIVGVDTIAYLSTSGFCGEDTLTYRVCDQRIPSLCDTSYVSFSITPRDSDGDGIPDFYERYGDLDGDGIPNHLDQDSDGDTIPDSLEVVGDEGDCVFTLNDPDEDGKANFLDEDSDGDGLLDSAEVDRNKDGVWDDCDENGIPDWLDPFLCEEEAPFLIPQGFSPNGDGVNDQFVIVGLDQFPDNALTIFNRWGNKVFEQKPYDNNWGGEDAVGSFSLGSGVLPEGTYFYILTLEGDESSGYIYLNR